METTKQRISVLQAICCTVIIISYFLPWIQISILGFEKSSSLIDGITGILKFIADANKYSVQNNAFITFYPFLLILIPMFAMLNAILQWVWKSIHTAFYLNLIPLAICSFIIYIFSDSIKDGKSGFFEIIGPGFAITLIASLISAIHSWTVTAISYVKHNNKFLKIISIIVVISLFLGIIINLTTKSNSFELLIGHSETYEKILGSIGSIAWLITFTHLFFILYAWIVVQIKTSNNIPTTDNRREENNSIGKEIQECPNCHKKMETEWIICPYCGFKKNNENQDDNNNEANTEDDNLRFAPPEYRNNNIQK